MTASFTARCPRLSRTLAMATVALVVLLVTAWVTPRASGAAAAWPRSPSVNLKTLRAPGGSLTVAGPEGRDAGAPVTLDAGVRFSMAGVVCDVPSPGAVTIRLRASADGASWGPWLTAPLEVVDEHGTPQAFTDPIWTGAARYVQVRAAGSSQRGPARLTGVRLVAIDPTGEAGAAARVTGVPRRIAAAVTDVGLTGGASATTAAPAIVTRAEWGADESLRSGSPSYAPVAVAFVHHTASGNVYSQADAPGIVRAVYAYHTKTLGWDDVGYNFLIDRFGTIYEGRYGGVARGVIGAQVGGFNTGSTGIAVLGTFTDEAPPAEAVAALERLLAWKLGVHGLDPTGSATLTCGFTDKYKKGETVTFPVIAGHRQANHTECPGDAFYALLPAIRAAVAKRMGSAVVATLSATAPLISPNGDGVLDATELDVSITAPADWRLALKDARGQTVASWSGQGATATITWNGTSNGADVPDGVYTARLTTTPAGGDATGATAQITVDTAAPPLASAAASPASFSPNGDGQTETASVSYRPTEACDIRVGILDAGGRRRPLASRLGRPGVLARTPSPGTAASPPAAASSPRATASTASRWSAVTQRVTSPGRASRSPSTRPSTPRSPPRSRSLRTATAYMTSPSSDSR